MEVTTPEQCKSAFSITNYYHDDVTGAIKGMLDEATDELGLSILSGLLRGSLQHLLDEAKKRIEAATLDAGGGGKRMATQFDDDFQLVAQAVMQAREIQEFIWAEESLSRKDFDPERWRYVFQKRVDAIAEIHPSSQSAMVELRKRLLQQAALSIKALVVVRRMCAKEN